MTETIGPMEGTNRRYGSESYPSASETSVRPSNLVWACSWRFLVATVNSVYMCVFRPPILPYQPPPSRYAGTLASVKLGPPKNCLKIPEIQQAASLKVSHFVINNIINSWISYSSEGQSTTDWSKGYQPGSNNSRCIHIRNYTTITIAYPVLESHGKRARGLL